MRLWLLNGFLLTLLCIFAGNPAYAQTKPAVLQPGVKSSQEKQIEKAPEGASADAAGIEYFEKKVRPALVQYCYECHSHSAKKSLGNLYLDSRKGLLQGGQSGVALVPGDPTKSRFIEAVLYTRPDLQMPPKTKLPPAVIADLTEWVKMGAPWPQEKDPGSVGAGLTSAADQKKLHHWAWQPVRKPLLPNVKRKAWVRNPIDQFILAKLEAKNLTPAPRADKRTLIRRAYFDLIGLPPTPEEVDAFLTDASSDAWEKLVDRLLASPHYGERWGRYWLDVARYGEDQAHSFDPRLYPQGFRYRDWIAQAFNSDMPYDRFIKEQIAADLLNEPDMREQLPALGFFATGPVYYGDGQMFDQYDDRIDTLSRGVLGLTVACARCHDHKFDPITQKDYYGLAGIFASTTYAEVPVGDTKAKFGKAEASIDRRNLINAQNQEIDKFLNEQQGHVRSSLTPEIARYMAAAWKLQNRRKTAPNTSVDQVAASEGLQSVVLERWVKYLKEAGEKNKPQLAAWQQVLKQEDPKVDQSGNEKSIADARRAATDFQNYIMLLQKRRETSVPEHKTVAVNLTSTTKNSSGDSSGATPTNSPAKLENQKLEKQEEAALEEITGKDGVLAVPKDQLEKVLPPEGKEHLKTLKSAMERLQTAPFIHSLMDAPNSVNLPVLIRGNAEKHGDIAPRHFLAVLSGGNPPTYDHGSGRLELANAIADKNNPLTARVMVNRIWQHHFGRGIVRTTSNFGLLGETPTHPELLDYLASRFIEKGWSLKSLHREIMLSATYQMSGTQNARNYEVDPDNKLLWRMTTRRLEVESWRDAMLSVSGKLDLTIGGPSVSLASPDNFRRTYYAVISRHDLDSMLRMFDFPDPNATVDSRMTTTVPLQQLFVLNSEFMIRQAKAFAARLTANPAETDTTRIRRAFLLANSRPPTDRELLLGLAFLHASKPEPTNSTAVVTKQTIANGGTAPPVDNANHLTRWEEYAQVLLSTNEFMYVD